MQLRPKYSVITNQILHNFFVNISNVSMMNVRCEKIYYHSRDIEFFLSDYFFSAPCSLVKIESDHQ